jgi:hypothetical protein
MATKKPFTASQCLLDALSPLFSTYQVVRHVGLHLLPLLLLLKGAPNGLAILDERGEHVGAQRLLQAPPVKGHPRGQQPLCRIKHDGGMGGAKELVEILV